MARTHFGCDSCARPIAPSDPRIRCLECPEYDLCADCAIGERFTQAHAAAHSTLVFKNQRHRHEAGRRGETPGLSMSRLRCRLPSSHTRKILRQSLRFLAHLEHRRPPPPPPPPTQHISIPQTLPGSQRISTASALSSQPSYTSPLSAPPDVSEATLLSRDPGFPSDRDLPSTAAAHESHADAARTQPASFDKVPRADGGYYTPQQDGASGIGGYTPASAPPLRRLRVPPPRDSAYSTPPHEGTEPPAHFERIRDLFVGAVGPRYGPAGSPQQGGASRIGGYTPPPRDGGYGTPLQEASTEPVLGPQLQHVNGTTPPAHSSRTRVYPPSLLWGVRHRAMTDITRNSRIARRGLVDILCLRAPVRLLRPLRAVAPTPPPLYALAQEASTEPVRGWGPFFAEDMSPTPLFSQLMETIFTYLDTSRTGYLTPETYSRFLVNQGYVGSDNIWNANLIAARTTTLGIDYILHTRAPERPAAVAPPTPLAHVQIRRHRFRAPRIAAPAPASSSTMPALTRKGFADLTAVALLSDPARAWGCFAGVLRMYEVPQVRAWGLLPREVLPLEADPRMLERVAHRAAVAKGQRQQARTDTICRTSPRWRAPRTQWSAPRTTVVGTANMMVHNLVKVEGAVAGRRDEP
ncbi:hypothetical protein DFH09DRAFT_1374398 [Mycena vulgaris]|nr:hypothetical protein DFH09DRAFT_1374398 [Mycena vulgaris]